VSSSHSSALYGVDGARSGWVFARASADLQDISLWVESDLERLFSEVIATSATLAIDIPIGLPDSGPRECDRAARRMLGWPRLTSVFSAPMRPALTAKSYWEACALNEESCGKKLSRQSFALFPKLREVDALMTPDRQSIIREAHPEIAFMLLSGLDRGLATNKKTAAGRAERSEMLGRWLPGVDVSQLLASVKRSDARPDDVLDALACLVAAWRIANGNEITLPAGREEHDVRGLRMEIVV
jgi:predicted RNase H-like nuclease